MNDIYLVVVFTRFDRLMVTITVYSAYQSVFRKGTFNGETILLSSNGKVHLYVSCQCMHRSHNILGFVNFSMSADHVQR